MAAMFSTPAFTPVSRLTITNPTRLPYYNTATKTPSILPTKSSTPFTAIFCSATRHSRRPEYIPDRISDPLYVRIFDTTLCPGEHSPSVLPSVGKLDVARQLAKLGVDIIQAGFPASSKDDLEDCKIIAKEVGNEVDENGYVPVICGMAGCNKKDIDASWEAVKHAKRPRIHIVMTATDSKKGTKEEVIEVGASIVRYARSVGCDDVQFTLEIAEM